MGYAAIPYVVAAIGAGASYYNTSQTAKKQDQAAALGVQQQAENQREADQKVNQQLDELATSNADDERQASMDQYLTQLRKTRSQANASVPAVAGASERYTQDVADRTAESDATATRVADLMSRIDAPAYQRLNEGQQFGRLESDINQIKRNAEGDDFLTQLRVKNINRNPWIDALSGAAQGYSLGSAATSMGGLSESGVNRVVSSGTRVNNPYLSTGYLA